MSRGGRGCGYEIPMDRESGERKSQSVSNATAGDTHSIGVMTITKRKNRACTANSVMSRGDDSRNNVLVRIYDHSETLLFDRMTEVKAFERMPHLGQGPRLLGRFTNGHLTEFLNARTLSGPGLRDTNISQSIVVKLHVEGLSHLKLWERLRDWLDKSK
ncbi:hypothetical protein SUGI_0623070 [Cryptomeria japonica]|nr:hypothetical protein SUGI_0623070 [Cryptomeria japonica]